MVAPTAFARAFFALRQCLLARNLDTQKLASRIRRACAAADQMVSSSIQSSFLRQDNTKKGMETAKATFGRLLKELHAIQICYPSLLEAVEQLSAGAGIVENCVFEIVQLFQNILGHLHTTAAMKTEIITRDKGSLNQKKPRAAKQQNVGILDLDEVLVLLTKLAVHFFDALDLSKLLHNRLLEGLACVFLDHLGSSLSLVVFADNDGTGKANSLGVLPPRGLIESSGFDRRIAVGSTQREASHLISILRQLMLCIEEQQILVGSGDAHLLTIKKSLAASKGGFAANVRKKLQNTLLRGVFGHDDEWFEDAFRRPAAEASTEEDAVTSPDIEGNGEWFVGEVWCVLGWDILSEQNRAAGD
jgi:hypothetical protein